MSRDDDLHGDLLGDPAVAVHLSARATVQAMLDVEAALAEVEARHGIVPEASVAPIRSAANAALYDLDVLAAEAAADGNLTVPLVRHLTRRVATIDPSAAGHVHWGATSQDVIDTALVLQLQRAAAPIRASLDRACASAAALARRHVETVMPGRTWLQQATPVTFGLKAAGWLDALDRQRAALGHAFDGARVLQFGGASGTLAALGDAGPRVADALGERLDLVVPAVPWHAHRDRLVTLACSLGIVCGVCGKVARDLALLAQTEVAEAFETREQGGGSSTMPHKRNPVSASIALAASVRAPGLVSTMLAAMPQEHERGLGGWQAEWKTLPDLLIVCAGGTRAIADALEGLNVDADRMRANAATTRGLVLAEAVAMTLAAHIGRHEAHRLVEAAATNVTRTGRALADVLIADARVTAHLSPADVHRLLAPERYLGAARTFVERVLARTGHAG